VWIYGNPAGNLRYPAARGFNALGKAMVGSTELREARCWNERSL
jgi:hypothetical protein